MTALKDLPEEILEAARDGLCWDACEGTRKGHICHLEDHCDGFEDFARELMDEEKDQAHADMQETERRLTRDMVNDWRRANP